MKDFDQFEFTESGKEKVKEIISFYPEGRQQSAVIPLLDLAQNESEGWLPMAAIEHVADLLGMAQIRVLEVASFYSMFNLKPVGKYFVQLCRTTPCWLRGSESLKETAEDITGCKPGETSSDGLFTLIEVECLGACCNAPMVQINNDYYEDLTQESFREGLELRKRGEKPSPGSVVGRKGSEPVNGRSVLSTDKG